MTVRGGQADGPFAVLVFSKTAKYRHKCIPVGNTALVELGQTHGFSVEVTEDANAFTADNLKRFAVVVFHNTTGDVLDEAQEDVFEAYIQGGGGFAGIHAATDTEYDWPWYNELVGGYFAGHPKVQPARHELIDGDHPSTAHLEDRFVRTDEWYNFKKYNENVSVLLELDETTYKGGKMGDFHPIAWYHDFDGGRAWYTGGGHTNESVFRARLPPAHPGRNFLGGGGARCRRRASSSPQTPSRSERAAGGFAPVGPGARAARTAGRRSCSVKKDDACGAATPAARWVRKALTHPTKTRRKWIVIAEPADVLAERPLGIRRFAVSRPA